MRLIPACLLVVWAAVWPSISAASEPDSTSAQVTDEAPRSRLFPPRFATRGYVYLPKVHHSSETSFGIGGEIVRPFQFRDDSSPESEISAEGRYTFKNQVRLEFRADLNWGDGDWTFKTKLSYDGLPVRFWGIGPDTPAENEEVYRPQRLLGYVELMRTVFGRARLGIRVEAENFQLLEREAGGIIDVDPPSGAGNTTVVGTGLLFERDTRDSRRSPRTGALIQGFALWFDNGLGSDFDLNNYNFEYRRYYPIQGNHILATQLFLYSARGAPPFWRFAALGGRNHTRGYRKDRYLDTLLVAFQGEYRSPYWWRMGLVGFAGLGQVAENYDKLKLETMRPTVGAGLRAKLNRNKDFVARGDVAFGNGSIRFYFSIGQAF